ncbi:hypothetical protein POM88_054134 [Heracleum sosnowskyi]|uniref:Uncharacterized protein n=1 Tax=Heracleum sosnowskyi TaxID=360622 RepID=A0AAD8LV47_9APIA|nr:hypothetical protein POM88_054134 [Heracleum sosnowskyi]
MRRRTRTSVPPTLFPVLTRPPTIVHDHHHYNIHVVSDVEGLVSELREQLFIHLNRFSTLGSINTRIFYFDAHVDDDLDLNKKAKKFNFISCRGLLVEGNLSGALTIPEIKYRIYNPTTKRVLDLPNPQKKVIVMRVFLNSSTNSYHVVSLYTDKTNNVKFELIDLGGQSNDPCPNGDLSWRALNIPDFDVASRLQKYDCSRCVLEEGILFMPAEKQTVFHTVKTSMELHRVQKSVQETTSDQEEIQHGPFPVEQLQLPLEQGGREGTSLFGLLS